MKNKNLNQALLDQCVVANLHQISELIGTGADVNCLGSVTGTPLIMIARFCNTNTTSFACAELLINSGADVNKVDINGETALSEAVDSHSFELVKLFVDNGANVLGNSSSINPLSMGADIEIATYLLEHGADPFLQDASGETPYEFYSRLAEEHEGDDVDYKPDFKSILVLFDNYSRH